MLLFITPRWIRSFRRERVSIHHMLLFISSLVRQQQRKICFNTSHVTLYQVPVSLADRLLLCFNTSHVTLYHMGRQREYGRKVFQYITCYSLSIDHPKYGQYVWMFQYITCYSLSLRLEAVAGVLLRFNTSHVTLYLFVQMFSFSDIRCFNTSHVTLYQIYNHQRLSCAEVSIHHMLLFILMD